MGIFRATAAKIADYNNPNSYVSRLRFRRLAPLLTMIEAAYLVHGEVKIIDLGGTPRYWRLLPEKFLTDRQVTVLLVNPEPLKGADLEPPFASLQADACHLPEFSTDAFHIVHSNSVIEHVGALSQRQAFAQEVRRLAPAYFVQTPNYWYPIEPHFLTLFFQFLPLKVRAWMLQHFHLGHFTCTHDYQMALQTVREIRLLGMSGFRRLFPEAKIIKERPLFLTKSLVAIRYQRED